MAPVVYPNLLACWRVSWTSFIRLVSKIRGTISAAAEPYKEKQHAVLSFDTQDDAITVRLL